MARERGGFVRDAFLEIAVGDDGVDLVIGDGEIRRVERGGDKYFWPMARPTELPVPWPSGPVVTSTPSVSWLSG